MTTLQLPDEVLQHILELSLYSYERPQARYEQDRDSLDQFFWQHPASYIIPCRPDVDYMHGTTLSLVCRAWKRFAQKVMYRYVDICRISEQAAEKRCEGLRGLALKRAKDESLESELDRWISFYHSISNLDTALAGYVQYLRITKHKEVPRLINHILDVVINLTSIELSSELVYTVRSKPIWKQLDSIYLNGILLDDEDLRRPRFVSLGQIPALDEREYVLSRLPDASMFPSTLKRLQVQYTALSTRVIASPVSNSFPNLTHLTLKEWPRSPSGCFPFMMGSIPTFPNLTHLALHAPRSPPGEHLMKLLKIIGVNLKSFTVMDYQSRRGDPVAIHLTAELLRTMPHLTQLNYSVDAHIELAMDELLQAFPRSLRELRLGWRGGGAFDTDIVELLTERDNKGLYHLPSLIELPLLIRLPPYQAQSATAEQVAELNRQGSDYRTKVNALLPLLWRNNWPCPDLHSNEGCYTIWAMCCHQDTFNRLCGLNTKNGQSKTKKSAVRRRTQKLRWKEGK